jgi:hypothetical protein
MIEQNLDYIHHNPVSGKWNLVEDFSSYGHSSASFYELGLLGKFEVTHYKDLTRSEESFFLSVWLFAGEAAESRRPVTLRGNKLPARLFLPLPKLIPEKITFIPLWPHRLIRCEKSYQKIQSNVY